MGSSDSSAPAWTRAQAIPVHQHEHGLKQFQCTSMNMGSSDSSAPAWTWAQAIPVHQHEHGLKQFQCTSMNMGSSDSSAPAWTWAQAIPMYQISRLPTPTPSTAPTRRCLIGTNYNVMNWQTSILLKTVFPRLVCLSNAQITVHCARKQTNVPTNCVSNIRIWARSPNSCLIIVMAFPQLTYLATWPLNAPDDNCCPHALHLSSCHAVTNSGKTTSVHYISKQDGQCTYCVTIRGVCETIVAVEKQ
jgi:hypothetical protein